jgi:hypothetical protein
VGAEPSVERGLDRAEGILRSGAALRTFDRAKELVHPTSG